MESQCTSEGKKVSKPFKFDAEVVKYKDEDVPIRGELLFEELDLTPMSNGGPPGDFVSVLEKELKTWIGKDFSEQEVAKLFMTTHWPSVSAAFKLSIDDGRQEDLDLISEVLYIQYSRNK